MLTSGRIAGIVTQGIRRCPAFLPYRAAVASGFERTGARSARGLAVLGFVCVLGMTSAAAGHDKTDIATTDDGGTYIGEIKGVKYATLSLNTDPAGLLKIEWRHVTGLQSKFDYRIELSGGVLHFGKLGPPSKPKHLNIVGTAGSVEVDLTEVVAITPVEHGFVKRLDGSVNFGLTYTQSNNALQYNLSADVFYRGRKTLGVLSAQSIFSQQDDGEPTNQHYLKLVVSQLGKHKWGAFEMGQLQSNPDQGYDLRFIGGGGATNALVEEAKRLFVLNLGAVYNREEVTDSPEIDQSAEVLVGLAFHRFEHGPNSPDMQVDLQTFTNVTDTPRFRVGFAFKLSWDIIGNFTVNLQVNDNYDSNPPGTDSENNDLSVVTSIGYTF